MAGAREIRDAVAGRRVSATEVCTDTIARIEARDPQIGAFRTILRERALGRAAEIDRRPDLSGLPLAGVPVALKDNLCMRAVETTAGSRLLAGYCPPYDATVVERLERAGAIVVGKTNCDEFAMGSSTENSAFGPTRNPWSLERTPGGSSGGSAAAVAAEMVPLALGSDTGGSIRQPAALCGVVGFKPTYGRVSRYGLVAFASSFDQIGPIAGNVADAALVYDAIAGHDPRDATSSERPLAPPIAATLDGTRVGVPRDLLSAGTDPDVLAAFESALALMSDAGAVLSDIALPHAGTGIPVYYVIATAEASANLARYDGVRYGRRARDVSSLDELYGRSRGEGFGDEVKRRIILGTYVLSAGYYDAYYGKAQQVRALIVDDYEHAFRSVDLIALPTSPTAAFLLGERLRDPIRMYLADVFTVGANLAGLPAISVPCGLTTGGLPVGLQLVGPSMADRAVLAGAQAYEQISPWTERRPIAHS